MTKPPPPPKRKLGIFPRKFNINSSNIDDGQYFYVYCEKLKKLDIDDIFVDSKKAEWSAPYDWDVDTKNNWIWIRAHPKKLKVPPRKFRDEDGDLTITITFNPPDDDEPEDVVYGDVEYVPETPVVKSPKKSKRKKKSSKQQAKPAGKDRPG
jgi:hypothetical protein